MSDDYGLGDLPPRKPMGKTTAKSPAEQVAEFRRQRAIARGEPVEGNAAPLDFTLVEFTPDLAMNAREIRVDGEVFVHGVTYQVPAYALAQYKEIEFRTWQHEASLRADDANFLNRQRALQNGPYATLSPRHGATSRYL